MPKTITITVEIYDGTTAEQVEAIVGEALNENGVDCTYEIEERED